MYSYGVQWLDLSFNQLTGTIASPNAYEVQHVFYLPLTYLILTSNMLSGTIPVNLTTISFLQMLYFGSNKFTGQLNFVGPQLANLTVQGNPQISLSTKFPGFVSHTYLLYCIIIIIIIFFFFFFFFSSSFFAFCPQITCSQERSRRQLQQQVWISWLSRITISRARYPPRSPP